MYNTYLCILKHAKLTHFLRMDPGFSFHKKSTHQLKKLAVTPESPQVAFRRISDTVPQGVYCPSGMNCYYADHVNDMHLTEIDQQMQSSIALNKSILGQLYVLTK